MLRTGVDLIEISRVAGMIERHGARFLNRVFTGLEQRDCAGRASSLAARFAAKEAAAKALGCGIGDVSWLEIEIRSDARRAPYLVLAGEGERLAKEQGLTTWSVSLSHAENMAIAFVAAMGE
ncbi:MAG: holo-[acyl-carrier-protein] synthase [Chloroflexi bacterium]|nr:holo-[acyl-carrier-protein] synthase [Chloroflexi bacterium CFX1]MCQ3952075.1 holo-[acyl-carrier-protein] synthase [Chloroflexota bacterium]MDL1919445.1 holo-[acyl-carrier-protein] synthase [Chloroflexi bacterium CFX5]NUQ57869.1 holo-ACP synthase [Anaerolineales bacterium]RIK52985.1 MAG: holo-[acyl-carrier-protein] synthase [Chloroflexota bacterium]